MRLTELIQLALADGQGVECPECTNEHGHTVIDANAATITLVCPECGERFMVSREKVELPPTGSVELL